MGPRLDLRKPLALSAASLMVVSLGITTSASASTSGREVPVTAQPIHESEYTPAANTCPQGAVCGWTQPNRQGTRTVYASPDPACHGFPTARSVSNQSGNRVRFFEVNDLGCTDGDHFDLESGYYSDRTPFPVGSIGVYGG